MYISSIGVELLTPLLGALASLIIGLVTSLAQRGIFGSRVENKTQEDPTEKLDRLTRNLSEASADFKSHLEEISVLAQSREKAVTELEFTMTELGKREKALKTQISQLENTPVAVAEYFKSVTAAGEKRGAIRDYVLFTSGVIVSTIIALLMR